MKIGLIDCDSHNFPNLPLMKISAWCERGMKSYKVADLSEFWNGQKNIVLLNPNTISCPDWKDILQQQ